MKEYDATEIAYKNGYEHGKAEAIKEFWNNRPERLNELFVDNPEYNKGWNACLDEFGYIREQFLDQITKEMGCGE